jgi:hypothetical protein
MFAKSVSNGSLGKLHKALTVVAALMVLLGSLPVRQAYAWTNVQPWGSPPRVSARTLDVIGGSNAYGQVVISVMGRGPSFPSYNLQWGNHRIKARYQLEKWMMGTDNIYRWYQIAHVVHWEPVSAGTGPTVFLPNVNFQISWADRGYYRVKYRIWWISSTAGTFAYTAVVPNTSSDFICQHALLFGRRCQTGNGWFWQGY